MLRTLILTLNKWIIFQGPLQENEFAGNIFMAYKK